MHAPELTITPSDWASVLGIGLFFSTALSLFLYLFLDLPVWHGLTFGAILGGMIAFFSWAFFSFTNRFIFPKLSKKLWILLGALVAFLAGFLGTLAGFLSAKILALTLPAKLEPLLLPMAATIGILTYAFGALIYRFVRLRHVNQELDTLLLQSRLKSLETQLNPHFLFNALNSLAELLHVNTQKAEALTLGLSRFLRNTMSEKALISLQEELDNTRAYVALEQIRYGEALRLHVKTPQDFLAHHVPKFSVQLLVENSIKHGFKGEAFTITIEAFHANGTSWVSVSNPGTSITPATLGIGLTNLQERLGHLYQGELKQNSTAKHVIFTFSLGAPHAHSHC
jgi:sensor histidine kinase YesM